MKLIIAGTRTFNCYSSEELLDGIVDLVLPEDTMLSEVISGGCKTGVDAWAKMWANSGTVIYTEEEADWNDLSHPEAVIKTRKNGTKYNAAAGPIRNRKMAKLGDALLLIWDGESKGSANMKKEMEKLNKPVYEVIIKKCN